MARSARSAQDDKLAGVLVKETKNQRGGGKRATRMSAQSCHFLSLLSWWSRYLHGSLVCFGNCPPISAPTVNPRPAPRSPTANLALVQSLLSHNVPAPYAKNAPSPIPPMSPPSSQYVGGAVAMSRGIAFGVAGKDWKSWVRCWACAVVATAVRRTIRKVARRIMASASVL